MGRRPEGQQGVASRAVEFQARFHDILARAQAERESEPVAPTRLGPVIAISRERGTGGLEIANELARRMGWKVLDRELVATIAERLEVAPKLLELMDETRSDWFRDSLLTLLEPRLLVQDTYVRRLAKIIMLAAFDGEVVIVGRGAQFVLPREAGLRVRLVAPMPFRIERVAREEGMEARDAERRIRDTDDDRAAFIKRHFRADLDDPLVHDMVVDVSAFGIDGTTELILDALRLRHPTA